VHHYLAKVMHKVYQGGRGQGGQIRRMRLDQVTRLALERPKHMKRTGERKGRKLVRKSISLDPDDYAAMEKLATQTEVSLSWLIRQSMRDFLDRYGDHGQPELALRIGGRRGEGQ